MTAQGQGPEGGPCPPLHGKGLVQNTVIYYWNNLSKLDKVNKVIEFNKFNTLNKAN